MSTQEEGYFNLCCIMFIIIPCHFICFFFFTFLSVYEFGTVSNDLYIPNPLGYFSFENKYAEHAEYAVLRRDQSPA